MLAQGKNSWKPGYSSKFRPSLAIKETLTCLHENEAKFIFWKKKKKKNQNGRLRKKAYKHFGFFISLSPKILLPLLCKLTKLCYAQINKGGHARICHVSIIIKILWLLQGLQYNNLLTQSRSTPSKAYISRNSARLSMKVFLFSGSSAICEYAPEPAFQPPRNGILLPKLF